MTYRALLSSCVIASSVCAIAAPPAPAQSPKLTVVNFTDLPLSELYISPVTSDEWGDDRLMEPLPADSEAMITLAEVDLSQGCSYDILAVLEPSADDESIEIPYWNLNLCELVEGGYFVIFQEDVYANEDGFSHADANEDGFSLGVSPATGSAPTLWVVSPATGSAPTLWVVNNAATELFFLYAAPETDAETTNPDAAAKTDLLGDTYLLPGSSLAVLEGLDSDSCVYDFEAHSLPVSAEDDTPTAETRFSQDLCSDSFIAVGDQPVVAVLLDNTTNYELRQLYLMPVNSTSTSLGPDRLSWLTLASNQQLTIPVPVPPEEATACPHDVLAIFKASMDDSLTRANSEIYYAQDELDLCEAEGGVIDFTEGVFSEEPPDASAQ